MSASAIDDMREVARRMDAVAARAEAIRNDAELRRAHADFRARLRRIHAAATLPIEEVES